MFNTNNNSMKNTRIKRRWGLRTAILLAVLFSLGEITPLQAASITANASFQSQSKTVKVTIVDSQGTPLPGASIMVVGSDKGTTTNANGEATINVKPSDAIECTFVGMQKQVIAVQDQTSIKVVLSENNQKIDEVVVVAFGSQKKTTVTSSIAQVDNKVLQNRPVGNVSSALQGQVAGVTVTQSSGKPGENANIIIRGVGSLNSGTAPLVIIDGVPGTLSMVNPNDVESTSVLKDASASALYGARAANGVILITTKQAKQGKTVVNYNGYIGFQEPTELFKEADAYNYANAYNLANMYDVITASAPNFDPSKKIYTDKELEDWKTGKVASTDWRKELFKKNGFTQSHYVNVSGGINVENLSLKNSLSVGYYGQQGNLANTNYDRYNVRYNGEIKTKKITIGSTIGIGYSNSKEPTSYDVGDYKAIINAVNRQKPTEPVKDDNGNWNVTTATKDTRNPVRMAEEGGTAESKTYNILGNLNIKYNFTKDLALKFTNGANITTNNGESFANSLKWAGSSDINPNLSNKSNYRDIHYMQQLDLSYTKNFGSHNISGIVGGQQEFHEFENMWLSRKNFVNNSSSSMQLGADEGKDNYSEKYDWGIMGVFGRINYDYDRKYLLEANVRYDGSTRLTPGKNWDLFPSASIGWRISEEEFMKPYKHIISELKFRGGIGSLGNQNLPSIGDNNFNSQYYPYQAVIGSEGSFVFGDNIVKTLSVVQDPNTTFKWETTTTTDLGLVGTLYDGLINFEVTYFNKRTNGMLMTKEVSTVNGGKNYVSNMGSMKNYGWEFSLGMNKTTAQGIKIYANGNLSYLTNELTDLGGQKLPPNGVYLNQVGSRMNSYYLYISDGLLTKKEFLDPSVPKLSGQKYGDSKIKDLNKDGKINQADKVLIDKTPTPKWIYGINFDVSYKGLGIAGMLQGAADYYKYLGASVGYGFNSGYSVTKWAIDNSYNPLVDENNYDTQLPRLSIKNSINNTYPSDRWLFNCSYIRLKNLQVYYNLPSNLTGKIGISQAKVYLSGQNLYTLSSLPKDLGIDPEIGSATGGYPLVKTITMGVDITF